MTKKNIEQKEELNMTDVINQLISSSEKKDADGVTELTVDEYEMTRFLDSLVVILDIDRKICSNYSTLTKAKEQAKVSDDYASNIAGRMLLKAAGSKTLGVKRSEIDVADKDLQSYYLEHDLGRYTFDELMSERAKQTLFGGQPEIIPILRWRWNNEVIFMDYQQRVSHWMHNEGLHQQDLRVNAVINDALNYSKCLQIVDSDFAMFVEGSKEFAEWNPISQKVFSSIANSRLTLDREVIRALSKKMDE